MTYTTSEPDSIGSEMGIFPLHVSNFSTSTAVHDLITPKLRFWDCTGLSNQANLIGIPKEMVPQFIQNSFDCREFKAALNHAGLLRPVFFAPTRGGVKLRECWYKT